VLHDAQEQPAGGRHNFARSTTSARVSTRKKSGRAKRQAEGTARTSFPDLAAILGAFADAYAMIHVSRLAVADNDHSGPESVALRLGVEAFDKAYNQLDRAILDLEDIRETLDEGVSSQSAGGAS